MPGPTICYMITPISAGRIQNSCGQSDVPAPLRAGELSSRPEDVTAEGDLWRSCGSKITPSDRLTPPTSP
jgi:hypothetical protein